MSDPLFLRAAAFDAATGNPLLKLLLIVLADNIVGDGVAIWRPAELALAMETDQHTVASLVQEGLSKKLLRLEKYLGHTVVRVLPEYQEAAA